MQGRAHMEYVLGVNGRFLCHLGYSGQIPIMFPYIDLLRPQVKKYGNKEESIQ